MHGQRGREWNPHFSWSPIFSICLPGNKGSRKSISHNVRLGHDNAQNITPLPLLKYHTCRENIFTRFLVTSSSNIRWNMLCYVGYFFLALPIALWIYKELTMGVCRNKNSMTGKTVLITGGSEGIGLQTAIDLARRGAKVRRRQPDISGLISRVQSFTCSSW